jgi:hypothetical protein
MVLSFSGLIPDDIKSKVKILINTNIYCQKLEKPYKLRKFKGLLTQSD